MFIVKLMGHVASQKCAMNPVVEFPAFLLIMEVSRKFCPLSNLLLELRWVPMDENSLQVRYNILILNCVNVIMTKYFANSSFNNIQYSWAWNWPNLRLQAQCSYTYIALLRLVNLCRYTLHRPQLTYLLPY